MTHPVYKELTDAVQGHTLTAVDLVGIDDVTVELQLTFNNGVLLSIKAERDKTYGPVVKTEVRRLLTSRMLDEAVKVINGSAAATQEQTRVAKPSGFVTDHDEIEELFSNARAKLGVSTPFIDSVYAQYTQYGRLTLRQAETLKNIATRTKWSR